MLTVSLENVVIDLHELERGMALTKKELHNKKDHKEPPALIKDFLANSEDKFQKLLSDTKMAQVSAKWAVVNDVKFTPIV